MHLEDEFVVGKFGEDDLVVVGHRGVLRGMWSQDAWAESVMRTFRLRHAPD